MSAPPGREAAAQNGITGTRPKAETKRRAPRGLTIAQRIERNSIVTPSGCWEWQLGKDRDGYGRIQIGGRGGTWAAAHRVAYQVWVGSVPEGLVLDHLCRNRACVNAAHLEPVSVQTNTMRGIGPSAANAEKSHCVNGHEFNAENTYRRRDGGRQCRVCVREATRRYAERKRAS